MNEENKNIDAKRRAFLKRVLGAGFAAPVIATFSMSAKASAVNPCSFGVNEDALFLSFFEQYGDPTCAAQATTTPAPTTTGIN